jgi:hypothetical protein
MPRFGQIGENEFVAISSVAQAIMKMIFHPDTLAWQG